MGTMAEPVSTPLTALEFLPVGQLQPSPLNPRKRFDDGRLHELAESFKSVGVIEPLVARRVNGHYEIVCGDRRSRAARLAELETVPVIVKDLTDTQVLEIMVIENNQREDVNALEEADGFSRLLKTGYDIDRLAERIGRSKKYIYDRVKLLDLVPTAKNLLLDERFTPGHAILLARLKPEQQTKVLQEGVFQPEGRTLDDAGDAAIVRDDEPDEDFRDMKPRTVRELERHIADHVRFNVKDAAAAAPLEFGELAARVDQAAAKPGRGKKVISITLEHFVNPDARSEEDRTFGPRAFKFADGKPHEDGWSGKVSVAPSCEHVVLGVVVAGEKYGQGFDVCIAREKCQVHWKKEISEREKNQKLRDSGQTAKANESERRREEQWKREREEEEEKRKAWNALFPHALREFAAHVQSLKVTPNLVSQAIDRYHLNTIKNVAGGITDKNLGQVLALAIVLGAGTYSRAQFLETTKRFNFSLDAKPVAAKKKPASEKPAGKKKAGVQTSARGKKAKKR